MSAYIPLKGHYFWTRCRPYERVVGEFGGYLSEPKVVMQVDNSYSDNLLLCEARDNRMVVARRITGYGDALLNLPLDRWEFWPAGPEVLAAHGITQESEQ